MKTAVVYYSYTGNTRKYVEKIKEYIDCDIIEIKPKNDMTATGFKSYVLGGHKSLIKQKPELMSYKFDSKDYDLIIFASPVWAFTYAPALRSFFEKEIIENKKVSYLCTHEGNLGGIGKRFKSALKNNEIIDGVDINMRKDAKENLVKFEDWLKTLVK